jgi:hypothetical protein
MKLIKTLIATFALLSIATPSHAQNALGQLTNLLRNGNRSTPSGLPPTNLDSFVYQSGYNQAIYGDEGDVDIPPMNSFTKASRINAGINGQNAAGLTTGHGSFMPDAWGADEFIGNEWDFSGVGSSNPAYNLTATQLNATQAAQAALAAANMANSLAGNSTPNITSNANVNGTSVPVAPAVPAFVAAFGQWATQAVPYAVVPGMVPVQDSTNGMLMGWMAPGTSLSQFLSGSTGLLLPGETGEAQSMLQNLSPASDITVQMPGG